MANYGEDSFIWVRINPRSLNKMGKWFKYVTQSVQRVQEDRVAKAMKQIMTEAKMGTMMATGELVSLLARKRRRTPQGAHFSVGYFSGGSNGQAQAQEFDVGRAHRSVKAHHTSAGLAKCSRTPEDLWAFTSGTYRANTRAKRRALAIAIEHRMKTSVNHAVNTGGRLVYAPSSRNFAMELTVLTSKYLQAVNHA